MRQAVFSSLGEQVVGARFLDLFAGSGGYGLEALSRGASGGVFVEKNTKAVACLRKNIAAVCKSLGRDERALTILQMDAVRISIGGPDSPDIIFVDPPYEVIRSIAEPLFARFDELPNARKALVVFEMPGEIELTPTGWNCLKRLGKGARQPTVAFFQRS
jgi:16S rRNA (guanine966-N2)-methyltransferase